MFFPTCGIFLYSFILNYWVSHLRVYRVLFSWVFCRCCGKNLKCKPYKERYNHTEKSAPIVPDYIHLPAKCWAGEFGDVFLLRWHINEGLKLSVDHQTELSHWHFYTAYEKALLFHETKVQSPTCAGIAHLRVGDVMCLCLCIFSIC